MAVFKTFYKDENGATSIEYGLLVSAICIGILFGITSMGTSLNNILTTVANAI